MNFGGLAASYEVMLLLVLLLLFSALGERSGKAIDVDIQRDGSGSLLVDERSVQADLELKSLFFEGNIYEHPEELMQALEEKKIRAIALSPSEDTPAAELMRWLASLSAGGISVQLVSAEQDKN